MVVLNERLNLPRHLPLVNSPNRIFINHMGTAEHGNRRTDEQGTLNFEVPEQYFLIKHEGSKSTEENPRTVFF